MCKNECGEDATYEGFCSPDCANEYQQDIHDSAAYDRAGNR